MRETILQILSVTRIGKTLYWAVLNPPHYSTGQERSLIGWSIHHSLVVVLVSKP